MAINPTNEFVGKIASDPTNYPYGKARNITAPGDGLGTPFKDVLVNDVFGFQQALLKSAGIVPSGTPDKWGASEYLQAVVALASGRAFNYDESGVANAYVLDVRTDQEAPDAYFDGMIVIFTPGNNNTGASTVNVGGLGVKNLYLYGVALTASQLAGSRIEAHYNLSSDRFDIDDGVDEFYTVDEIAPAIGAGLTKDRTIANPLGTDDIDIIVTANVDLSGSEGDYVLTVADVSKKTQSIHGNLAYAISPPPPVFPTTGNITISVKNTTALTINVVLTVTMRRRRR